MSTPTSRTSVAIAERRRRADDAVQRVRDAITALRRRDARITVAEVARRAGVSRTFVYDNPEARATIAAALTDADRTLACLRVAADAAQFTGWRERALNAEDALKAAHNEIAVQRTRMGELLGQIRDLQAQWDDDTMARVTTENTSLKQRVGQLTTDNRTLQERLAAARSTMRFHDRRIADLESRITDPAAMT